MSKITKIDYSNKSLKNKNFLKLKFKKISFENCNLEKCNFWEMNLSDSKFNNSKIEKCIFTDTDLSNSIFHNTEIKNTNFTHSNLRGVNFKSSKLININLRDALYDSMTIWPKNFNPSKFGAIKDNDFNPFSYKAKLSYQTIKNFPKKKINKFKKKIINKNNTLKLNKIEKKIIKELTEGKGYIIIKNFYNKKTINKAEKIINKKLKNNKNYKKISSTYEIDKMKKSINFFNLLNIDETFVKIIQPKTVMNAFKKLMGENFVCTYYAAQCSLAGSRGQNLHLDYPYVSFSKPGQKIPIGMGSEKYLLSCGVLTYLNNYDPKNSGPILLNGSHKFRRFPTIEDVKRYKFTTAKVPKGGILILNTLMWHAGLPNYSESKDRSLIVAHYTPDFIKSRMDIKKNTNINVLQKDQKNKGILNKLLD